MLSLVRQVEQHQAPHQAAAHKPPPNDAMARFVSKVLHSTETIRQDIFHEQGHRYLDPKLVLFSGAIPTACGTGQSAMGPFYSPGDRKVYIDLTFYHDLKTRFHAPGEFAEAYVIAHEVGHRVQNLLGISEIENNLDSLIRYLEELDVRVTLVETDAENVSIAQLNNQQIVVNTCARDGLSCLFTIAHLFGHLVQRLTYEKYAHLLERAAKPKPIAVEEPFRKEFYDYEVEAFQLGKGLLLTCIEMDTELDSKYTLFMQTDFDHFWHYVTTGEQGDICTFNAMLTQAFQDWKTNQVFLDPLPHPRNIRLDRATLIEVI